jgi:hypothetical protein
VSGSSHDLNLGESSDQVLEGSHLSTGETQGNGDSQWKTFWDSYNNDGDGNDNYSQELSPHSASTEGEFFAHTAIIKWFTGGNVHATASDEMLIEF